MVECELTDYLKKLGLNDDVVLKVIDVMKFLKLKGTRKMGYDDVGLSYEQFRSYFQRCSQSYGNIKETLRKNVFHCDYEGKKGEKTYGYDIHHDLLRPLRNYSYKKYLADNRLKRKVFTNKIGRLSKGINDTYIRHNILTHGIMTETQDTRLYISNLKENADQENDLDERNSLDGKLIGILGNLENHRNLNFNTRYCEKDGRWYSPNVAYPNDFRDTFNINGKKRIAVVDIRACHPSFFAEYIISKSENASAELFEERNRWNEFFFAERHPIEVLSEVLGIYYDKLKLQFVSFLNGQGFSEKGNFFYYEKNLELHHWITANYPNLYSAWMKTDLKETGISISKRFESTIMQDASIFGWADEVGLHIASEHDGCSVYGDSLALVDELMEKFRRVCLEKFGLNLIIRYKKQNVEGVG